jgi:phosphoserine phosphatase RsbU/P
MAEASPDLGGKFQPGAFAAPGGAHATSAVTQRRLSARSPLVLIVDDDELSTFVIQHTLRAAGLQTLIANRVDAALGIISVRRPDLILLDVRLPDGSGIDVCRNLQADPAGAHTPVLFMSGIQDVSIKVLAFEAGGVDYITKPVSPAEVSARVFTHLRLKQAYEQLAALQAERIQRLALAQEALMPQPESVPGTQFAVARKQVLEAGGDFYDVMAIGPDIVDFVVADAAGHDLAASYWTAALKTLLAEYATSTNPPRNVLQQVNDALYRILPDEVFFTALYARYNRRARRLVIVNAGHPPAVLVPASGEPIAVVQEGDVVGSFEDAVFGTERLDVQPGDRLLMFTDGVIEFEGRRRAGLERVLASAARTRRRPLGEMVDQVLSDALHGQACQDDVVILGVEL